MGKHLSDEDIVVEEGDGLGEYRVIVIEGGGDDPLIEDRVSQEIDWEDLPLSNGEVKEGCYQTASACPSNWEWCSIVPR